MIIDKIENAHLYYGLGPHLDKALAFLQNGDFEGLTRLSLDEGNVSIGCMSYTTKPREQCNVETHYVYADIHVCLEGVEVIGYNHVSALEKKGGYDAEKDKQFFSGPMNTIRLTPGMFALTRKDDAHFVMCMENEPAPAKKLMIKCKL